MCTGVCAGERKPETHRGSLTTHFCGVVNLQAQHSWEQSQPVCTWQLRSLVLLHLPQWCPLRTSAQAYLHAHENTTILKIHVSHVPARCEVMCISRCKCYNAILEIVLYLEVWRSQMSVYVNDQTTVQFSALVKTAGSHCPRIMLYVPSAVSHRIKPKSVERQLIVILWKLTSPIINRSNRSIVRDTILHDWSVAQHMHRD